MILPTVIAAIFCFACGYAETDSFKGKKYKLRHWYRKFLKFTLGECICKGKLVFLPNGVAYCEECKKRI